MSRILYDVHLTDDERAQLDHLQRQSSVSHFTHRRARILLAAEHRPGSPPPTNAGVAAQVGMSSRTVSRVRARWAAVGVEATLCPAPRGTRGRTRFTTEDQARIAQVACSEPPAGHARWTVRLLAAKVVDLELVPAISPESVRQILKKTS